MRNGQAGYFVFYDREKGGTLYLMHPQIDSNKCITRMTQHSRLVHGAGDAKVLDKLKHQADNKEPQVPGKLRLGDENPPQDDCHSRVKHPADYLQPEN